MNYRCTGVLNAFEPHMFESHQLVMDILICAEGRSQAGSDRWPGNRADRPGQPAPVDRPVNRPIWPAGCPVDQPVARSTSWPAGCSVARLPGWPDGCPADWPVAWLTGWLASCLERPVAQLTGWPAGCLVHRLVVYLTGRLPGWPAVCPVHQPVARLTGLLLGWLAI